MGFPDLTLISDESCWARGLHSTYFIAIAVPLSIKKTFEKVDVNNLTHIFFKLFPFVFVCLLLTGKFTKFTFE